MTAGSGDLPLSREGHAWAKFVARMGYAARGVVYVIIGGLALLAALSMGGDSTGPEGALERLRSQPLGEFALVAIALGLVSHSLWRLVQSLMDADDHGTDAKGLVVRVGLFVSALTNLSLAFYAASLVIGWGGGGESGGDLTRRIMGAAAGQVVAIVVGLCVIGAGVAQIGKGLLRKYEKRLIIAQTKRRLLMPICAVGLVARGAVFVILGVLTLVAVARQESEDPRGIDGVLDMLRGAAFGRILLGAMALGLLAFAAYSFVLARYRRIATENAELPIG